MAEIDKDLQMQFAELSDGYKNERRQVDKELEICKPLYEADFCHDICGTPHACFDKKYIEDLKRVVGADVRNFIGAYLKDLFSTHVNYTHVYMSNVAVDYIIEELEHYRNTGEWNDCTK